MTEYVSIKPELIRWALERSRLSVDEVRQRYPKLDEWLSGERSPTFRQLEAFAQKTMTPLGYLFLDSPPDETLPIPDFRTVGDTPIDRPSPNLLETMQMMQRRQAWMREYVIEDGHDPLEFIGSVKNAKNVVSLAVRIRKALGLRVDWAGMFTSKTDAIGELRDASERIGILIAINSIVGNSTNRPLDPEEFRGFVLCDEYAPLIFVNSADSKSAQLFTLAHELVHLWLGKDGLFNLIRMVALDTATERFCNQVAAEFLVPGDELAKRWNEVRNKSEPFDEIARLFKISPVVAARRAWDLGLISKHKFFAFYEQNQREWLSRKAIEKAKNKSGGPGFYTLQPSRLGRRFSYAVVRAAREGRLLYRDAYQLTGLKGATFTRYADDVMQRMKDERQ